MNCIEQTSTEQWAMYRGDCVEVISGLPAKSVDYSIFSPPFASLYTYSNSPRDMGNVKSDEEFFEHFGFLIDQLARVMKAGRNVSFHCMLLPTSKERDGYIGLKDFRGDLIRAFQAKGFIYASEVCIWKDPVTAMQRTKALGLLHKTVRGNASMSRQGIPDYLVTMRAPGECVDRVTHDAADYPVSKWQRIAQPIWTDIDPSDTLQFKSAREHDDERHICLARGSLVLTSMGYKPIQDVDVGDMVLTHKGRWRPVEVVRNMGVRPVITVKAQGVPGLTLTPDHKLWTRPVASDAWSVTHSRASAKQSTPEWIDASETVGNYINQVAPEKDKCVISDQELWLVGRWIADGHMDARGSYIVSIGHAKIDGFKAMAGDHYGGEQNLSAMQVRLVGLSFQAKQLLALCGNGASNKEIPAWVFCYPAEKAKSLLDGYLSGDGHFLKSRNRWTASTVSKKLALGISMLAQIAYGAISSVYAGRPAGTTVIEGRKVSTKQDWIVCFDMPDKSRQKSMPFVGDDGAWKKVRSAAEAGEAETWCLRVLEDASFTAEGCVVANCPLQLEVIRRGIDLWTNPGDVVLTPFAGIGSEVYVAAEMKRFGVGVELKASYYDQAVRNLRQMSAQGDLFGAAG